MSYRQLIITDNIKKASIENNNIKLINYFDEKINIAIEDIFIILVETQKIALTANFLSKCADNKIVVIICDEKHNPNVICNGYNTNYRQLQVLEMQMYLNNQIKGILWQQLIKQKIKNQYLVLNLTTNNLDDIGMLQEYYKTVEFMDLANREGIAAKIFFKSLHGSEFIRFYDDNINDALNFGYTILTSAITRELVSFGLDPKIGIWHNSKTNPFNLACDLVEPFRPIIDYFVYEYKNTLNDGLSLQLRRQLINILNIRMKLHGKMQTLQNCIHYAVKSFIAILEGKNSDLYLADLEKVEFKENE